MLAYLNDPKVKNKYVRRFRAHMKADEVMQGIGYESNGKTQGCAVGCTLNRYDHKAFETELGIPESVARLLDVIFEGLPEEDAPKFALDFLLSIKPGSDLTRIRYKFCVFLMQEILGRVEALTLNIGVKKRILDAIRGSLKANELASKTGRFPTRNSPRILGGMKAAMYAGESAGSAASAARSAARMEEGSAAWATTSAAWGAGFTHSNVFKVSGAELAAIEAAYQIYAKEFLRLIRAEAVASAGT